MRATPVARFAAALAFAVGCFPVALAQSAFNTSSVTPSQLPAGNGAFTATATVTSFTGAPPASFCVYSGYGSTAPITPSSVTPLGNAQFSAVFAVPASTIQQIPASAYQSFSGETPFFSVPVYVPANGITACAAYPYSTGASDIILSFPTVNALSLNNIPDQNPNLPKRIPSNLNLSGTFFVPNGGGSSSTVTFSSGGVSDTAATTYIKSTSLEANLPTNIPPGSGTVSVTACNQSAGNSYCAAPLQFSLYPLAANPGALTATPAAPAPGQSTSFAVGFGPTPIAAQNGALGGQVVFTDGSTRLGTAPLVLDKTAQLTQLQSDGNASRFISTSSTLQSFIADFNGDGVPDTMFLDSAASTFHFLLGLPPYVGDNVVVPSGIQCSSIPSAAVADFNKDGIPDIAFICQQGNLSVVYAMLGLGDGTTFGTPIVAARGTASFLAANDFNHDARPDLVTLTTSTSGNGTPQVSFTVYTGDGTGNFQQQDTSGPFAAVPVKLTAAGDFDGDGAYDLVLLASAGGSGPGVYVFHNQLDANQRYGSFAAPLQPINGDYSNVRVSPMKKTPTSPASCVFSCTLPSLIAIDSANGRLLTALNQSSAGTISFFDTLEAVDAPVSNAIVGDFDGDGLVDVAIVGSSGVAVLIGDGAGNFVSTSYPSLADPAAPTNGIAVGSMDENGDGFADLLVLNQTSNCTTTCAFLSYTYTEVGYVTAGTSHANFTDQAGFAPGPHTITATTPGTFTIAGGSASTSFTIASPQVTPAVNLLASPASGSPYGTATVLTFTITGTIADPTGMVSLYNGDSLLGTVTLPGTSLTATATFNAGVLAPGVYALSATYSGDTNYTTASATIRYGVTQATPTVTWNPNPATLTYGTPLGAGQLDATANVPGTFAYTPAPGAVLPVGPQQLTAVFTPTDTTNYKPVSVSANILITQATVSVTWSPNPASIVYGTPLGSGQLDATASVPGTFVYTPAAGTVLNGGLQPLTAVFTPTDSTDYQSTSATTTINVTPAVPPTSWVPNPSTILTGTPLGAGQLDATSPIAGSFVYTPAAGTVLPAGTQTLSALFTPTNTANYQPATITTSISVVQAALQLSATTLAFGNEALGVPSATQVLTLTNPSPISLTVTAINPATGSDPLDFTQTNNCTTPLGQNASCQVTLTFTPNGVGLRTAGLGINYAFASSDQTYGAGVSLSGTGTGGLLQVNPGNLKTLAGTGTAGDTGDGGAATAAELNQPDGIAFDPQGNLYIADTQNSVIRKVDTSGTITTFAGNGTAGYAGDGGQAASAELNQPYSVTSDAAGNIYIQDTRNFVIRKVDTGGVISTIAGIAGTPGHAGDGSPATAATLDDSQGARFDAAGNFFVPQCKEPAIRKIDTSGTITTVAGNFTQGFSGDGGPATSAQLYCPSGAATDAAGNLYIADYFNNRIRKVDTSGTITTFAGNGTAGSAGDGGAATAAELSLPNDVVLDGAGNLYIADSGNNRIRKIDTTGIITTVAGGFQNAGSAGVNTPSAVAIDAGGNLDFSDSGNSEIHEYMPGGAVPFPATPLGVTAAPQTLTLSNIGNLPVTIPASSFTLSDNSGDFALSGGTCLAGATLTASGGSCTLEISFTPTAAGLRMLTVAIADNALNSPQTFTLSGTGQAIAATITWPTPASIGYGTALGAAQLDAVATGLGGVTLPGTFVYTPAAGAVLGAGTQTLSVTFTPTDATDYLPAAKTTTLLVAQASPTLAWATPAAIVAGTALSATQLDATATGVTGAALPGTFTYTPPAGTVLTAGTHQLSALFTPSDTVDYSTATATVSINVISLTLGSVSPNTALLGDADKTVTLTGTGFLPNSLAQVNGTSVATSYVSSTSLTAIIPHADFLQVGMLQVTVFDPTQGQSTNAEPLTVTPPPASVLLTGPTTTSTGLEPQITFQLQKPYPVDLVGTFTVTFAPANGSPDDPMIRFATSGTDTTDPSGRTFGFTIPANSTSTPLVLLQSGSTAGVLTVTLNLTAGGAVVTPSTVQPLVITAPDSVPGITSVSITASGKTLTVVTRGYSNTRELTQANFHFDAAPGKSLATKDLQIDEKSLFTQWYSSATSAKYGSTFTYTQTFNLDEDATVVGAVQVILTNSIGASALGSTD